jgi:hypothetical protein
MHLFLWMEISVIFISVRKSPKSAKTDVTDNITKKASCRKKLRQCGSDTNFGG